MGQGASNSRRRGRSVEVFPPTDSTVLNTNSIVRNPPVSVSRGRQTNFHSQPNTMMPTGHVLNLLLPPPSQIHSSQPVTISKYRTASQERLTITKEKQVELRFNFSISFTSFIKVFRAWKVL